jgi:ribonuclease HI
VESPNNFPRLSLSDAMIDPRALQIHPDGSCYLEEKRISGCAAWVVFPDHLALPEFQIVDFGCQASSNNRMELMACLKGLRWALENQPWKGVTCICVVTDSQYLVENDSRAPYWKKNGWRNRFGEPIANEDLWDDLLKCIAKLSRVGLRVQFHWQKGKRTPLGKTVDKAAKAAALRGELRQDFGYKPGSYSRSMVPGGGAAIRFQAAGQTAVIRPYRKKPYRGREERVSFHLFDECTSGYSGKFFAYAGPLLALELHKGNGYRVRFNSNPNFPQIVECIEDVPLPKPVRRKKSQSP